MLKSSTSSRVRALVLLTALTYSTTAVSAPPSARQPSPPPQGEIVIDAVVASVDDKPITLSELNERFVPPRKLSLTDAAHDPDAQKMLDALILEKLIQEEATSRRVSATDSEVEEYINEVSRRNKLTRPDFERELVSEGGNLAAYKRQVRLDILRTKLASSLTRGGVSVSDQEIDDYIGQHPELTSSGVSLKLRQILISTANRSPEEVKQRLDEATHELEGGADFAEVAKKYSDGPQAQDGGLIGIVAEKDLSKDVFDAVFTLENGERSQPIETESGVQLFQVEQRFSKGSAEGAGSGLREEVRKTLLQQKTQEKLSSYFVSELYKNHAVDKKI